jgi:hypothetical protein
MRGRAETRVVLALFSRVSLPFDVSMYCVLIFNGLWFARLEASRVSFQQRVKRLLLGTKMTKSIVFLFPSEIRSLNSCHFSCSCNRFLKTKLTIQSHLPKRIKFFFFNKVNLNILNECKRNIRMDKIKILEFII